MSKKEEARRRWIEDTQMFQRIAGTPETPADELGKEWDSWNGSRKQRAAESIKTHRAIQDAAISAAKNRRN